MRRGTSETSQLRLMPPVGVFMVSLLLLLLDVLLLAPTVSSWQTTQGGKYGDEESSLSRLLSRRQWTDTVFSTGLAVPIFANGISIMTSPAFAKEQETTTTTTTTKLAPKKPYLTPEYFLPGSTAAQAGRSFFPTLTPPFRNRATYRYTLGRQAWAFEQLLTFFNVTATIRCNVVQLEQTGGLWVHSPQWPTGEFCQLLDDLQAPVEHVVLPCNALEHKAPMKAFVQKYPQAQVWIAPGQYGPFGECNTYNKALLQEGQHTASSNNNKMGYRVDGILLGAEQQPLLSSTKSVSSSPPSWAEEFDFATLYVDLPQNAGPVSEVAFCHRPTKTLIATDAVVFIPGRGVPEIFGSYFDRDTVQDPTFWPRTALQAVFLPLRTDETGNYPGFDALKDRLVRGPILRAFADGRAPDAVRDWVKQIAQWDFDRILTSHFASPVAAGPRDFAAAYGYLMNEGGGGGDLPPIACRDWELLDGLNRLIAEYRLGSPTVFDYEVGCQ